MSRAFHRAARLEPFDRRWAAAVLDWIASSEELLCWSARTDFPLTDTAVFDHWHSDPEVAPDVLSVGDEARAYGEIWFDEAGGSAELGRLIVSPRHRRQGLGRLLIEQLVSIAQEAGYRQIGVCVFPTNAPALRCYESAGFSKIPEGEEAALNAGQRFPFVWLRWNDRSDR